jgi:hypothetical protein
MEYLLDYYSREETDMVEGLLSDSYRFCCCRKPDTLMPNSCGVCGAYLDDGAFGCTEDKCLYEERKLEECRCVEEPAPLPLPLVEEPTHLPLPLVEEPTPLPLPLEEAKPRATRAPKEAEIFWPYMRAKRLVKFLHMKTDSKRPSYLELLAMIAKLAHITQEELYKTSPRAYFDKIRFGSICADAFMRGVRS